MLDTNSFAASRYQQPESLHDRLGTSGYSLPSLDGLSWHPMPGGGTNNWMLVEKPDTGYTFNIGPDCSNNVLVIRRGSKCVGHVFIRGSNNTAILSGVDTGHHPVSVHFHSSRHVFFWGAGCTSNTATFEMGTAGTSIIVGEDCMFAAFIGASTDDMHPIIDLADGEQLNPAADILIEPHVWVGINAQIRKGVTVGFGSIIGAGSTVTHDVPRRSAVVGSPARITRENVSWLRRRYTDDQPLRFIRDLEHRYVCP